VQSAVLTAPRRVELREVATPEPEGSQVRIRLQGCGICASSVPLFEGRSWFSYPRDPGEPGHEGWGTVDAVGPDVRHLQPGDRVGVLSYRAFAECDLADASQVVVLPPAVGARPFPVEPLACALNVFRRSDVRAGDTVAVVGIGFLGGLLVQLARGAGARVIALSRRPFSRRVAERCGADVVLPLADVGDAIADVRRLTGVRGCERAIECVGMQGALDVASELVGVRGRLIIAGYHQDGLRQVNLQSWNWRGLDVVNAHERDAAEYVHGARLAIDAVCEGRLELEPLLTHAYPLADLGEALEATATRPDGFLKAWVET